MRTALLLSLALGAAGPARAWAAVSTEFKQERAVKRPDGSRLAYYFVPPSRKSFPLLLYLDGSGCASAESLLGYFGPFVDLGFGAAILQKRGVKAGDSGNACSEEYLRTNDRGQRVGDAKLFLFRGRKLFPGWNGKLVVVGGSEGGALAPEVGLSYAGTTAVVSLAGGGWNQGEELKKMKEKELAGSGTSPDKIRAELARLEKKFEEIQKSPVASKSFMGKANTYKSWASYLWHSPLEFFVKLKAPVYVAQGTRDGSTPIESSDAVRDRFKALGKTNLVYRRYAGLDHNWTDAQGKDHTEQIIGDLLEWLGRFVKS